MDRRCDWQSAVIYILHAFDRNLFRFLIFSVSVSPSTPLILLFHEVFLVLLATGTLLDQQDGVVASSGFSEETATSKPAGKLICSV